MITRRAATKITAFITCSRAIQLGKPHPSSLRPARSTIRRQMHRRTAIGQHRQKIPRRQIINLCMFLPGSRNIKPRKPRKLVIAGNLIPLTSKIATTPPRAKNRHMTKPRMKSLSLLSSGNTVRRRRKHIRIKRLHRARRPCKAPKVLPPAKVMDVNS